MECFKRYWCLGISRSGSKWTRVVLCGGWFTKARFETSELADVRFRPCIRRWGWFGPVVAGAGRGCGRPGQLPQACPWARMAKYSCQDVPRDMGTISQGSHSGDGAMYLADSVVWSFAGQNLRHAADYLALVAVRA